MRIFVTGGRGMLGQAVCRVLSEKSEVVSPGRDKLDITHQAQVDKWLKETRPGWVFHLAALTNVDQCQQEPELAYKTNTLATQHLVNSCREIDAGLLFVSSIAVFNGQKDGAYDEGDQPAPINIYGDSKWQAEQIVATLPQHLIVRSGWLFGGGSVDKKFVGKMLELAAKYESLSVVDDKIGSPTYVEDLARGLMRLFEQKVRGLYHLVNSGEPISRFALAQTILQMAGLTTPVNPVSSDFFPQLAPRPGMEAATSHHTNNWLPNWRASLKTYIKRLETGDHHA